MSKMRVSVISILIFVLLVLTVSADTTNIRINVNESRLNIPANMGYAFIDNQSRTMIPLRAVSEGLGHDVDWVSASQTAIIDGNVHITIGQNIVITPSGQVTMDTRAVLKGGRTYVPLRFVVEALGYEVEYQGPRSSNGHNHTINIKGNIATQPVTDQPADVVEIYTPDGPIYFSPSRDIDPLYNDLSDDKAEELMVYMHDSFEYTEHGDHIKLKFFQPELPAPMENVTVIQVIDQQDNFIFLYDGKTRENGLYTKLLDDGYIELTFNQIPPKNIKYIVVTGMIANDGARSIRVIEEIKTGQRAIDGYLNLY